MLVQDKWAEWGSKNPFNYQLLDTEFNRLYEAEDRFSQLMLIFCLLTIFVASLGLFGLVSYTTEQKIKEIGVRKVLGASVVNIVFLLCWNFLKLVIISTVLAIPFAYFSFDGWLENFAFRIEMQWQFFALAIISAAIIALATISYHTLSASTINPSKCLLHD